MKVVIIGAGRSGIGLAARLSTAGHSVTVIDRDPAVSHRAFEQHGLVALEGDATDAAVLKEAGVDRAEVVAALLRRDADNLAVALLSRSLGAARVMVRIRDPAYRRVYEAVGVEEVLSEVDVLVGALVTAVEHPGLKRSMVLGDGASVAFELVVPEDAVVAGKPVREIAGDPAFPRGCVFAGVSDAEGLVTAPRGDSVVPGGSSVILVAGQDGIAEAMAFLTRRRRRKRA